MCGALSIIVNVVPVVSGCQPRARAVRRVGTCAARGDAIGTRRSAAALARERQHRATPRDTPPALGLWRLACAASARRHRRCWRFRLRLCGNGFAPRVRFSCGCGRASYDRATSAPTSSVGPTSAGCQPRSATTASKIGASLLRLLMSEPFPKPVRAAPCASPGAHLSNRCTPTGPAHYAASAAPMRIAGAVCR